MNKDFFTYTFFSVLFVFVMACSSKDRVEETLTDDDSDSNTPEATTVVNQHTVTFDTDGGSEIAAVQVDEGEKVTKPEDPTKDIALFVDWYDASQQVADGKDPTLFDFDTAIVADITLKAIWDVDTVLEEKKEVATQAAYQKEEDGAPTRPTWIDGFRFYPELDFFKQGRYILMWRKDPGGGEPAERFELHQIRFENPDAMKTDDKWGKTIDPRDVEETVVLTTITDPPLQPNGEYKFPMDLLPANQFSNIGSDDRNTSGDLTYGQKTEWLTNNAQVGYFGLNAENGSRASVVAYKVRAFTTVKDTDAKGNVIDKELYNDSPVVMVNFREGSWTLVTSEESASTGGGANPANYEIVEDELKSIADVRTKLGFPADAYFSSDWESRKVRGTVPVEELLTQADYEALFPNRKEGHDPNGTYYTWQNFVKAASYFPKFLGEGTKEDRYRELAAFFGNKGQEIGLVKGAANQAEGATEERYSHGMAFIVEISALSGRISGGNAEQLTNQDDLYNGYSGNYTLTPHEYMPVDRKSYHGRGPVQLSWNYNYGLMSNRLFGDAKILLENPNLIARDGVLGWASAIWFWMEPQSPKPSAHDTMVGNVDFEDTVNGQPYLPPYYVDNNPDNDQDPFTELDGEVIRQTRPYKSTSRGTNAKGEPVDYSTLQAFSGLEVGFGMTINIINGGLEANLGLGGKKDYRVVRRTTYYAKYLDYFGTSKNGREDGRRLPISPQVGGNGGDPVPDEVVQAFQNWKKWYYMPYEAFGKDPDLVFPYRTVTSIILANYQNSIR